MNEKIQAVLNDSRKASAITGVVAFAGGVAAGYFLARRKTGYGVHEVVDSPLYVDAESKLVPREPFVVDAEALERINARTEAGEVFVRDQMTTSVIEGLPEEAPEPVRQSVFAHDDDEWNYEAEVACRNENKPYVIHKDEFFADEAGYTQSTISYYAGDDILCDEDDVPVYNHDEVIGPRQFGHGSGDPNVFYVRNDKRKAEYEVLLNSGSYSTEVLGLEIEDNAREADIKHSAPRFRRED